jgi:hypothetical protein
MQRANMNLANSVCEMQQTQTNFECYEHNLHQSRKLGKISTKFLFGVRNSG